MESNKTYTKEDKITFLPDLVNSCKAFGAVFTILTTRFRTVPADDDHGAYDIANIDFLVTDEYGHSRMVSQEFPLTGGKVWKLAHLLVAAELADPELLEGASIHVPWESFAGASGTCSLGNKCDRDEYGKWHKECRIAYLMRPRMVFED